MIWVENGVMINDLDLEILPPVVKLFYAYYDNYFVIGVLLWLNIQYWVRYLEFLFQNGVYSNNN